MRRVRTIMLASVLAGCSVQRGQDLGQSGANRPKLQEQAHDGKFDLPPGQRTTVDANSDLVLSFTRAVDLSTDAGFVAFVDEVVKLGKEREAIVAETIEVASEPSRRAEAKTLVDRKAAELAGKVATLVQTLIGLGYSSKEVTAIMTLGEFPVGTRFPGGNRVVTRDDATKYVYKNFVAWLQHQKEQLMTTAKARAASGNLLEVTVQAFHDPVGQQRKQLHVDNYDNLPAGDYRPIERFRLDMTPAEQERFRRELRQSELIAGALRQIGEQSEAMRAQLKPLLRDLRDEWKKVVGALAEDLRARLTAALPAALAGPARTRLEGAIKDLMDRVDAVVLAGKEWNELLRPPGGLSELVLQFDKLVAAMAKAEAALKAIGELPGLAKALSEDADAGDALKKLVTDVVTDSLQSFLDRAKSSVPAVTALLELIRPLLGLVAVGGDTPPPTAEPLWHALADAPDARIELARAGLTLGDQLLIKTTLRRPGTTVAVATETYKADVDLIGWHREISAELIFARGDTGPGTAKDWKPNVAAVADLHYTFRDPSGWGSTWNLLDPALGVHVASLDQTDDSVEFGMGGNLSLFGGFVTGGVGWNLSASGGDGWYYFIGIDLFDVLNTGKKAFGGVQ